MDTCQLDQLKKLEAHILTRELRPADPVGLRFDRLAREGWLPASCSSAAALGSQAGSYWTCNCLAVAALLDGCRNVLVACEESWAGGSCLPPAARVTRRHDGWHDGRPVAAGECEASGPSPRMSLFDAVLADSSVLLSGDLSETLSGYRRALDTGGRVVLLAANWEYEMEGESIRYDLSFKRYREKVYAGLVKRTLEPPREVEYVCLLDPNDSSVKVMAKLPRDRLRLMGVPDVPGLEQLVTAAEVIDIPQATVRSLEAAGRESGFSRSIAAGAPGMLAARLCGAPPFSGACQSYRGVAKGTAPGGSEMSSGPANDVHRALASSFPFVSSVGSPHLLAVFVS